MKKTKGSHFIKIGSVIFLIYGAASLLAIVLSLFSAEAMAQYGLAERLHSPLPVLSVALAVLTPILYLVAGLFGMLRADKPKGAVPCLWLGAAVLLLTAADIVYSLLTGSPLGVAVLLGYALDVLVPIVYLTGAWQNLHAE